MKKILIALTSLVLVAVSALTFTACGGVKGKVNVKYSDATAIVGGLKSGAETIGMLAEPAATMLEKQTQGTTWYRLSLQELYDGEAKSYPQAVLMVKSSLLKAYPSIVDDIQNKISENVTWAKANAGLAVGAIQSSYANTTLKAPMLSEKAIDGCNIYAQNAQDAKASVNKYISDIRSIDEKSANEVGDDFFYSTESASGSWAKDSIEFYSPDGAPAVAIAKFIAEKQAFGTNKTVNYNVVNASEIIAKMANGSADILVMPINGATKKYNANANDPYKLVSVITHGNFYIMSKEEIKSVNDLIDKRVAVPNMGAVPDWTLQVALKNNRLEINVVD